MVDMDFGEEFRMSIFPGEEGVSAALCEYKDFYIPGHKGALVYLNSESNLLIVLDRIDKNSGKILTSKIKTTEDNRIALHEMKEEPQHFAKPFSRV